MAEPARDGKTQTVLQFLAFCSVGVANTALDFAIFMALAVGLGMNAIIANVISFSCGALCSFLLNGRFTFAIGRTQDARPMRPLRFAIVTLATLGLSTLVLKFAALALPLPLAKLVSVVASLGFGFPLNRYWVFGPVKSGTTGTA